MKPRMLVAVAMASLCHAVAAAQGPEASAPLQMGLPSAPLQMGLPSAPLQNPPPFAAGPDLFRTGPETYAPRFDRLATPDPRLVPCCGLVLGAPLAALAWPGKTRAARERHALLEPHPGYLRLVVEPGSALVHVNGAYRGTVDDLVGLLVLEAGRHRVELRAPGYEPVVFDVEIGPGRPLTYRAALERREPVRPPPPAAAPKTFYVIPNCYAGDRPPVEGRLPPGCRAADVRTVPPVVHEERPR